MDPGAIAAAPALGCGFHQTFPSEPAVRPDSITIDSIFPLPGTRLAPGSTVVFGTVLSYAAHENLGGGIIVQMGDPNGHELANSFPGISLPQGAGTVTVTTQFQIPSSGINQVEIDYLLLATPGETTEIVAATKQVSYPVGR